MPKVTKETKLFIQKLKAEMQEWGITADDVAQASKTHRLNIGRGYTHQQVRNYLNNRSAMPSGLADFIIQMIEQRVAHYQLDVATMTEMKKRLQDAAQARQAIQSQTL